MCLPRWRFPKLLLDGSTPMGHAMPLYHSDGREIKGATMARVSAVPGRAIWGWWEEIVVDGEGKPIIRHDLLVTVRKVGRIYWRFPDYINPNDPVVRDYYERRGVVWPSR